MDLRERQDELQVEAAEVLATFVPVFESVGPVVLTGSYVSRLMSWPEVDVMVLGGEDYAPRDVMDLLRRVIEVPGVVKLDYSDDRGPRRPTEHLRDERYHVGIVAEHRTRTWTVDLSIWLRDVHDNLRVWHEELRESITAEERDAVLWIKDACPEYPRLVGGVDVYAAVLEHGVRTPGEFGAWVRERAHPS
ncbi:hypothetical protein ACFQ1S_04340 [Kibdelosporangium lantanae]|uniref:Polymerase nucleotidyl transferase domain-containing protein n=1 Tax=Kibdelosporangium lantanae TaxID=1497396 RepID=A0ABW3M467_9PSEU